MDNNIVNANYNGEFIEIYRGSYDGSLEANINGHFVFETRAGISAAIHKAQSIIDDKHDKHDKHDSHYDEYIHKNYDYNNSFYKEVNEGYEREYKDAWANENGDGTYLADNRSAKKMPKQVEPVPEPVPEPPKPRLDFLTVRHMF